MAKKPKRSEAPKRARVGHRSEAARPPKRPTSCTTPPIPGHRWERPLQAPGRMQVDFEERVDFRRLHDYRLARTRNALAARNSARCSASISTTSATSRAR